MKFIKISEIAIAVVTEMDTMNLLFIVFSYIYSENMLKIIDI